MTISRLEAGRPDARREPSNEERILIERLVNRQGVSRDEANDLVEQHRRGRRPAIDPALMEGLDDL